MAPTYLLQQGSIVMQMMCEFAVQNMLRGVQGGLQDIEVAV